MADREAILARLAAILETVAAADNGISGRNLPRMDNFKLPLYAMYDGDEEAADNPQETGRAPNIVNALPVFTIIFADAVKTIGTTGNLKLAKLQKAVLQDDALLALCKGFRPRGPRYLGCTFTMTDEANKPTAELTVRFSVAYPFMPNTL